MKRRTLLLSGSTSFALAMTGCGGGEGDTALAPGSGTEDELLAARRRPRTTAPAPAPAPAPASSLIPGIAYPFGARLVPYSHGTLPSQGKTAMDAVLTRQYDAWKAHAVKPADFITPGGYAVQFSPATYLAVSEGMGYGMLLAVLFAGHDPQARSLFDGLFAVVRARPAYGLAQHNPDGQYLMDWRLHPNGTSAGEGWNALDGDEDIAMALLMADKQWGSGGRWNYLQEARNTINAMKSCNMKPDGTTKGLGTPNVSRSSDYMIGHFRAYQAATGDSFWNMAIDRAYELTNRMQTVYSAGIGLVPDFIVDTHTATPRPSPGMMGDGNYNEDRYWWNACRNPWRYASDYLLSGDERWKTVTTRLIDFIQGACGGNPANIGAGYLLNGSKATDYTDPSFNAPFCAGACVDARYQGFVDSLWNWNVDHLTTGYYAAELQLLSMVVASGNWWTPVNFVAAAVQQPATSTPTAPAATAGILVNGDFSNGLTGWNNWGTSAQVVGGALQVGTAAAGAGQDISVTAGGRYHLSGQAHVTAAAEGVFIGIKLVDSAGAVLYDQNQLVSAQTPAGVSLYFTAPQGAAGGQVYVWKNANSAIGVVDNLALVALA